MKPIVIVGSGFAGSLLSRLLAARGRTVTLIERGTHPRFALGESSTPLAAIGLERLAARYDLPDLAALAAYGRWSRDLPHLRRGLKRGFTFYAHRPGAPFEVDPRAANRFLVAASPSDEVADAHWLRSDVDAWMVERAAAEGVEVLDACQIETLERRPAGWRLEGIRRGRRVGLDAAFVVDATGAGGFLADRLGLPDAADPRPAGGTAGARLATGLVFDHFENAGSFAAVATPGGGFVPEGPYPEERAAVHHLLEEGWMYVLPFDDGRVSAGLVLDRAHPDTPGLLAGSPWTAWQRVLGRYPALRAQFAEARPVHGVRTLPRLQRRLGRGAGPGWAALPHAFFFLSPMFSTGIASSITAVERLAEALSTEGPDRWRGDAYDALLQTEADLLTELIVPAYRLRGRFDRFVAWSHLYFATASYMEAWQRLADPAADWTSVGFLGATDPVIRRALRDAARVLASPASAKDRATSATSEAALRPTRADCARAERLVAPLIAPRNLAGLADPARELLYPVDLDALVANAHLLGLAAEDVERRMPRLRGGAASPTLPA